MICNSCLRLLLQKVVKLVLVSLPELIKFVSRTALALRAGFKVRTEVHLLIAGHLCVSASSTTSRVQHEARAQHLFLLLWR